MTKEIRSEADPNIRINLQNILDERKMSLRELSRRTETRFETIRIFANGQLKHIPIDALGKICKILNVNICDLIEYERD